MNHQIECAWQRFFETGSISDYLIYKQLLSEEPKYEDFYQRIDHTGASCGGS